MSKPKVSNEEIYYALIHGLALVDSAFILRRHIGVRVSKTKEIPEQIVQHYHEAYCRHRNVFAVIHNSLEAYLTVTLNAYFLERAKGQQTNMHRLLKRIRNKDKTIEDEYEKFIQFSESFKLQGGKMSLMDSLKSQRNRGYAHLQIGNYTPLQDAHYCFVIEQIRSLMYRIDKYIQTDKVKNYKDIADFLNPTLDLNTIQKARELKVTFAVQSVFNSLLRQYVDQVNVETTSNKYVEGYEKFDKNIDRKTKKIIQKFQAFDLSNSLVPESFIQNRHMLIPSHLAPIERVELGSISLKPGPRVNYRSSNGSSYINSIEINDSVDKKILEEWLIYHSFVTNSRTPINFYMQDGLSDTLEILDTAPYALKDYDEFTNTIYYRNSDDAEAINCKAYEELYKQYIALDSEKKSLVRSYLISLKEGGRADRQLFDLSYWQIVKNYSIIERILGSREFCSETMDCSQCSLRQRQHYPSPTDKWLKKSLCVSMGQSAWCDAYFKIISTCRNKIRHKVVHEAKMSEATTPEPVNSNRVGQIDYTPEKAVAEFEENKHALNALSGMLESITWYLLMNHLFGHKIFAEPTGYSVVYLTIVASRQLKQ